jgi:hypothetical protein
MIDLLYYQLSVLIVIMLSDGWLIVNKTNHNAYFGLYLVNL